jgi:hypothetical protein
VEAGVSAAAEALGLAAGAVVVAEVLAGAEQAISQELPPDEQDVTAMENNSPKAPGMRMPGVFIISIECAQPM